VTALAPTPDLTFLGTLEGWRAWRILSLDPPRGWVGSVRC
jgi:hypothetical protein